jgi:hypothetical protein
MFPCAGGQDALDSSTDVLTGVGNLAIIAQESKVCAPKVIDIPQISGSGLFFESDDEDVTGIAFDYCALVGFGQQPDVGVPVLKGHAFKE